jgi:DNA-binding CsgD family transcriptional regulator
MTETVIKLLNADTCAFSQVEAEVLRRVSEGSTINSISTELGLAEPIVKEYIRSLLRKVRMRDVERTTGSEDGGAMPKEELLEVLLGGTDTRLQSLGGRPRPARWNQLNWNR